MTTWLRKQCIVEVYAFDNTEEALELIKRLEKKGWINTGINWINLTFVVELEQVFCELKHSKRDEK